MLACRNWGISADEALLPEHRIAVLLLQANDLFFGATNGHKSALIAGGGCTE
jgi:hypothetical protein